MKCPKCGYLGFDQGDRCRNCGYDFSLAPAAGPASQRVASAEPDPLDRALDSGPLQAKPALDLDRMIGTPEPAPAVDLPLFVPTQGEPAERSLSRDMAAGGVATWAPSRPSHEDAPLITTPSRPRVPLGVRRATPEIPRARTPRPTPSQSETLFDVSQDTVISRPRENQDVPAPAGELPAGSISRVGAGLIDASLLVAVDAVVLYFTSRLTGAEVDQLPLLPLAAFLLLLNGGYFVAFTSVGGQSIGKMAFGIKVMTQDDESVPVSRATLRTLAYLLSALPLGAGFLAGLFSADRLALHDRLAHTRVVRPSST